MEANHTPGPWDKVKRTSDHTYLGTKNKPIAEICPLYGSESEANLRLIASAPELLEACEKAKEFIDLNVSGGGVWHSKLSAAHLAVEFAIAKAKGRNDV